MTKPKTAADKISIGMSDKYGMGLCAGESVQIVNGVNSGTKLYRIRAAGRPYTITGDLSEAKGSGETLEVASKKVIKLESQAR